MTKSSNRDNKNKTVSKVVILWFDSPAPNHTLTDICVLLIMATQSCCGDWIYLKALLTCSFLAEGIIFILPTLCGYHHVIKCPRSKAAERALTERLGNGESLNNMVIMR